MSKSTTIAHGGVARKKKFEREGGGYEGVPLILGVFLCIVSFFMTGTDSSGEELNPKNSLNHRRQSPHILGLGESWGFNEILLYHIVNVQEYEMRTLSKVVTFPK